MFAGLASGNSADLNGSYGLSNVPTSGYAGNTLSANGGSSGNPNVSGGISLGPSLCGSALCP